ncbi:VCBS repeat-containing protein [Myxococcus sp. CA033]|uniref:FG-GAP and VCBS repeat-containing protein n=1 Tax=unclassified Myxococcus TaxID=2648731 RepID=UPI00157A98D6|nr:MULTISPECIES: VCBS repeat-containing protein [unclassified Myxococcus]NTX36346.1 VCBS repeat-containing protein [Myxococcus sp. CA033]
MTPTPRETSRRRRLVLAACVAGLGLVVPQLSFADPNCLPGDTRPICNPTETEPPPPVPFWIQNGQRFFVIGTYDYPKRDYADAGLADLLPSLDKTDLGLGELGRAGFNAVIVDIHDLTPADLDKMESHGVHALGSAWNWSDRGGALSELHWVREKDAQHHIGSDLDLKIQALKGKPAFLGYESQDEMGWNKVGSGQVAQFADGGVNLVLTTSQRARIPSVTEATSFRAFVNSRDPSHLVYYTEVAAPNAGGFPSGGPLLPGLSPAAYEQWSDGANAWGHDRYPIYVTLEGYSPPFPEAPLMGPAETLDAMQVLYDQDSASPYVAKGPILMVLQGQGGGECCSTWQNPLTGRRPNYIETRFMAYSSIIHGARGIFWWGTDAIEQDSQLWWDIKKVASQLRILEPALVADGAWGLMLTPGLEGTHRKIGQHHVVIVANPTPSPITATIHPQTWNGTLPARSLFEQRSPIPYSSSLGGWEDTFGPWEVHVYTDTPMYQRKDDFDGDGKSDFTWYWKSPAMPQTGLLTVKTSSLPRPMGLAGGLPGDISLTGDYDGDGLTDFAVYTPAWSATTPGFFSVWRSQGQHWSWFGLGGPGDIPLAADYDGDGITDIAVYQRFPTPEGTPPNLVYGQFKWISSQTGDPEPILFKAGEPDDVPVVGDFDEDGRDDFALYKYKSSTGWGGWFSVWVLQGTGGFWDWDTMGQVGDIPVIGDYDGDGASDRALYTPRWPANDGGGYFTILHSSTGTSHVKFLGGVSDVPVTGDYDGDGKTDIAVYTPRAGTPETGGFYTVTFSSTQTTSTQSRTGVRAGELPMGKEWQH